MIIKFIKLYTHYYLKINKTIVHNFYELFSFIRKLYISVEGWNKRDYFIL